MSQTETKSPGTIVPVILAGGAGRRLWPLSRESHPKPFLSLLGQRSLVQETLLRFADRRHFAAPIVVTGEETRFIVSEQLQEIGQSDAMIVLEPASRGTAPAIALAALLAIERDAEALLVVAPSDHVIGDIKAFHASLDIALRAARASFLVTFAVTPRRTETGYGYIQRGTPLTEVKDAYRIGSFIEKPDAYRAEQLIQDGAHFWNSGIFVFRAQAYLDELRLCAPEIVTAMQLALAGRSIDRFGNNLAFLRPAADAFAQCPSNSIDYALMERTQHACTVMLDAGWSDIGSWQELWRVVEKDANGNVIRGDTLLLDSHDCLVMGESGLTTLVGVNRLVVITTEDAVLIAALDRVQNVPDIVAQLHRDGRPEARHHRRIWRP